MFNFLILYPGYAVVLVLTILLIYRWFRCPDDRKRMEWLLAATLIVEPAGTLCQAAANAISALKPMKYDLYIYRIDQALGVHSFWLGELTARYWLLHLLASVIYGLLPVAMLGAFAANLMWGSEAEALAVARSLALNLLLALPIYLLIPVCGPQFAFPAFPAWPGSIVAHRIALAAAPNGIPSVHTSSALLVFWFWRRWTLGRTAGFLFLGLTILATLGSGEHYVFDLLCAVPYSTLIILINGKCLARPAVRIPQSYSPPGFETERTKITEFLSE